MSLSKVTFQLVGSYLNQLYQHPIRTKSITSCLVAVLGNYTAQRLSGVKQIRHDSIVAFGIFGLIFGGRIPHMFYEFLSRVIDEDSKYGNFQRLLLERLLFTPLYQFFSLYTLGRLEGKSHEESLNHTLKVFQPVLFANWKYLTLLHYVNVTFVPPLLRVFVANIIGFFWVVFITKRRAEQRKPKSA